MSELKLTLRTSRAATAQEIEDLVWGTGALAYPWWDGAHRTKKGVRFFFDRPEDDEGTFKGNRWVSHQAILDAAARFLSEGRCGGEDAAEALRDSIGYLDAGAADTVLQYAVLGSVVYG